MICVGVGFGSMGGDSLVGLVGGSDAKRWLLRWWCGVWVLGWLCFARLILVWICCDFCYIFFVILVWLCCDLLG